jgi:hypothetical protein
MICPRCGTTYPAGTTRCAACAVDLDATAAPEGADRAEWVELVTVYRAADPSELEVLHSLLEAEQIPCVIRDERSQDLVGLGRLPFGVNLATGPALLLVPAEMAEAARELIADHGAEIPAEQEPPPA